jgi:hypothetical protein
MDLVDKQTFTGEDIREYYCAECKESVIDRRGPALWKILSMRGTRAKTGRSSARPRGVVRAFLIRMDAR